MRSSSSGVYTIRHTAFDGRAYVGSSVDIAGRLQSHRSQLRRGKHSCRLLQQAFDQYGEAAFAFEVLELAPEAELATRENFWIAHVGGTFNRAKAGRHYASSQPQQPPYTVASPPAEFALPGLATPPAAIIPSPGRDWGTP
jgi:group I intron endonuclease